MLCGDKRICENRVLYCWQDCVSKNNYQIKTLCFCFMTAFVVFCTLKDIKVAKIVIPCHKNFLKCRPMNNKIFPLWFINLDILKVLL